MEHQDHADNIITRIADGGCGVLDNELLAIMPGKRQQEIMVYGIAAIDTVIDRVIDRYAGIR